MNLMKKLFPIIILTLSSCVSKTPSNSETLPSTDPATGTITPSTEEEPFVNTTKWSDDVANLMYETTHNVIPYIELASDFEYKVIEEQDENVFYILSKADIDRCEEYLEVVESAGYEQFGLDSTQGYTRYAYSQIINGYDVYIQFDYYPGGLYSKGFEIFTWSEPYVDPAIDYDVIEDWPLTVQAEMMDKFGEIIPVPPFSEEFEYIWVEEDHNFIFTDKKGKEDAFTQYFYELYYNDDWTWSESFYQQGYIVFEKLCTNIENGTFHLNIRHNNRTGFIIDVWYTIKLPPVLITEWSQDCLNAFKDLFGDENAIPLAPISTDYQMNYAHLQDGYNVIDIIDKNPIENFYEQYINILEAAGFVENDYYFPRFGNYVFEKVCPSDPDYNMVVDFTYVTEGISIQIYKEEVLSGTGFTHDFPVDQMKNHMKKYSITYQDVPVFPAGLDGRYLYTSRGPEFTIEIYTDGTLEVPYETVYKKLLEDNGWVIDSSHRTPTADWGYFARKEGYDFYLRFFSLADENEEIGAFVFHLYPNSYDCTQGFSNK